MNENISFRRLKTVIKDKGFTLYEVAEKCGLAPTQLSRICSGGIQPLSDKLAKLCSVLKCYPSEIVSFDGVVINEKYFSDDKREKLPSESNGELTYSPFWFFLGKYLEEVNKGKSKEEQKDHNDLFNQIEPPRRVNGQINDESKQKLREIILENINGRYGKDYEAQYKKHTDYSKGLPQATRTKIRNNRPLNLSVIYEICKFLGCSIDFVLGYK